MTGTNIYVRGGKLISIMKETARGLSFACNIEELKAGTRINPDAENLIIVHKYPSIIIPKAKYILCAKTPSEINSQQLECLYDLWPEPLTPALLKYFFRKLIAKLKAEPVRKSEEQKYQKRILEMAQQDYLTGLATRWYLNEYAESIHSEQNITYIYFDLDNFKKVNDTYGHQAGDRALAATAEMMQNEFPDGFCARMGGDEFMIVIPGELAADDAEQRVNAFMKNLTGYYASVRTMKALSVSAGISQKLNGEEKTIDRLIHESDTALYEAKKAGRACCKVYAASMERSNTEVQETVNYYLVDYENVKNHGFSGIQELNEEDEVCIFYSENALGSFTVELHQQLTETKAEIKYLKVDVGTKNALDFQLASYLGELIAENHSRTCNYFIVSNDKGFSSLVSFWARGKISVRVISDISGHNPASEDLKSKISGILNLQNEAEIAELAEIISCSVSKVEINKALSKKYHNAAKAGEVYRALRPLFTEKRGQVLNRQ